MDITDSLTNKATRILSQNVCNSIHFAVGSEIFPMNRILSVVLSVIKTKNGLLIFMVVGFAGEDPNNLIKVAAAASVPFASRLRTALCST